MERRTFLVTGTAALAVCSLPGTACTAQVPGAAPAGAVPEWEWVRAQFDLAPDHVHMRLAAMKHVRLHTLRNPRLSSGLVCFEVDAMTPEAAVARRSRGRRAITHLRLIGANRPTGPQRALVVA